MDDIPDLSGKGFSFGGGHERFEMFVVRREDVVFGYVNICPHARTSLDWTPDQFLNRDKTNLLCATHGAQFRIDDGFCVAGPCPGASLTRVPITITNGDVVIAGLIED